MTSVRRPAGSRLVAGWPFSALTGAMLGGVVVLGGCAAHPASDPMPAQVLAERRALVAAAEEARLADFLAESGDRLAQLGLPQPEFQGLVELVEWDAAVTACIERFDPAIEVARLEGGFRLLDPLAATESPERIRWTIESCRVQYGRFDPARPGDDPGPVERAWLRADAVDRILPCLRAERFAVPDPPAAGARLEAGPPSADGRLGAPPGGWSPYSRVPVGADGLARALALCPPSSALLAPPRGGEVRS